MKVLFANKHYMAIDVDAGHHEIEFAYSTPFLKEGAWLTAIGLMLLVFEFLYDSKKKSNARKMNNANKK